MDLPAPPIEDVRLDQVFRALAEPLRLAVIAELLAGSDGQERACASFTLPVAKSTRTYHWRTLREAGLIVQRDAGNGSFVKLRRPDFDRRFPGLLDALGRLTQQADSSAEPHPLPRDLGDNL